MTEYEKYSLLVNSLGVVVALIIAVIALWGEKLRQRWSIPKLHLKLDEPTLTSHTDNKEGWYYHLLITNNKKTVPAQNVRVLLCRVLKQGPDNSWYESKFSGPVQVMWRWPQNMPQYMTIGPDDHATFACLREDSSSIDLRLYWIPLNLKHLIPKNEPTRLEFKAVSGYCQLFCVNLIKRQIGTYLSNSICPPAQLHF